MFGHSLLSISHSYRSFVKDSIEPVSDGFSDVYSLVRVNPLAELSRYAPWGDFSQHRQSYKIDNSNIPENLKIFPTPVHYLPFKRYYRSLGEKHYSSVIKTIKKHDLSFDMIHAHFTWTAGYVGAKVKEDYHCPFVVTAHGHDVYSLPFKDQDWKEKIEFVLNTADAIITVSQSNKRCIDQLDVGSPVTVIPNGFSSDLFFPRDQTACRKKLGLPIDKKIILTAGNFVPVKGQMHLVAAMSEINNVRKDVLCIIIGNGPLESALKSEVKRLGLQSVILFPGRLTHDAVSVWMNACDLFVLPSLNEGNPTVMFEALGCGKPFVGMEVGGVPEIINSAELGILVDSGNFGDLGQKILTALDVAWDREKITSYSKAYNWESIGKKINDVYCQVLELS